MVKWGAFRKRQKQGLKARRDSNASTLTRQHSAGSLGRRTSKPDLENDQVFSNGTDHHTPAAVEQADHEPGRDMRFDATADRDITGLGTWGELAYSLEDPRHVLEGFHGQLSEPQEGALRELFGLVESLNLDLTLVRGQPAEPLRLCLLRFLRANGFNAPKALAQLEENVNFRDRENVADLLQQKASDVLGCDPEAINRYFPHWDFGEDRVGRPVLCKQYGGFVVSELLSLTTMESMVRSHVWEQEMTLRLMRQRSLARGAIVDSVVVIIDTGGMAMRQVTADFIALMKRVAHVDQAMYPELLGQMFIINTPGLFTYVWKMFAPLLDSRTRDKIKIFSRPRDWQPALLELIPADVLPPEYGGTGVPLADRPPVSATHEQLSADLLEETAANAGGGGVVGGSPGSGSAAATPPQRALRRASGSVTAESAGATPQRMASSRSTASTVAATTEDAHNSHTFAARTSPPQGAPLGGGTAAGAGGSGSGSVSFAAKAAAAVSSAMSSVLAAWNSGGAETNGEGGDESWGGGRSRSSSLNSEEFFDVMASLEEADVRDVVGHLRAEQAALAAIAASSGDAPIRESYRFSLRGGRRESARRMSCIAAAAMEEGMVGHSASLSPANCIIAQQGMSPGSPLTLVQNERPISWAWRSDQPGLAAALAAARKDEDAEGDAAKPLFVVPPAVAAAAAAAQRAAAAMAAVAVKVALALVHAWRVTGEFVSKAWWPCVKRLLAREQAQLVRWVHISLIVTAVLSVVVIGLGGYAMTDVFWVSESTGWLMWAAALAIIIGCAMLLLSVLGVHASRRRNTAALAVLRGFLGCSVMTLLLASALTCALAGGVDSIVELTNVESSLPQGTDTKTYIQEAFGKFLALGVVLLILALWLIIPFLLTCAILASVRRQRSGSEDAPDWLRMCERELRHTLRDSILFSAFFTVVIIGYAIHGVLYCMSTGLTRFANTMYLQLAGGFAFAIALALGTWASASVNPSALQLHLYTLVPCMVFMFAWSAVAFAQIHTADAYIVEHWDTLAVDASTQEVSLKTRLRTLLLVGGVLGISSVACMVSTLSGGFSLREHLMQHGSIYRDKWSMDRHYCLIRLSRPEWLLVAWGIASGLLSIFLEGTYVIFNGFLDMDGVWPTSFWRAWGNVDARYTNGDSFVVVMELLSALIIGPACLVYAWSVYSRKSFRHILGIGLCTVMLLLQIVYLATEIRDDLQHTKPNGQAAFWAGFVLTTVLRIILPALVLGYNIRHIYSRVRAAEIKYAKLLGEHQLLKQGVRRGRTASSAQLLHNVNRNASIAEEGMPGAPLLPFRSQST